eukprot:2438249-Rhodomonas_salina.1
MNADTTGDSSAPRGSVCCLASTLRASGVCLGSILGLSSLGLELEFNSKSVRVPLLAIEDRLRSCWSQADCLAGLVRLELQITPPVKGLPHPAYGSLAQGQPPIQGHPGAWGHFPWLSKPSLS